MIGLDVWVQPAYFAVGLLMIGLAGLLQLAKREAPTGPRRVLEAAGK